MKEIIKEAYIKDGIVIEPDEKVFILSRSGGRENTHFGTYLGLNSNLDPVVSYPSKRFRYISKTNYGWEPSTVTTSLPLGRIWSKNHFLE